MLKNKKIIFLVLSFLVLTIIFSFAFLENKKNTNKKISAKLITSVHKDLPLKFDSEQKNVILKPGEIKTINYSHPLFSKSSIKAQSKKSLINGKNNTFFSGAYWGYGFHEDGVNSALDVCNHFNMSLDE